MGAESDAVVCPFCGRDVWEDRFTAEPCEHLLADWAEDPGDNAGGVLGEMLSQNEGIMGAEQLGRVAWRLCGWVCSPGDDAVEARLTLAANAIAGDKPKWWDALSEAIRYSDFDMYRGRSTPSDEPEALAWLANPLAEAIVRDLPGITVTGDVLGGMTSGYSSFVWSQDPVTGRATVDAAASSAIQTLEGLVSALDEGDK